MFWILLIGPFFGVSALEYEKVSSESEAVSKKFQAKHFAGQVYEKHEQDVPFALNKCELWFEAGDERHPTNQRPVKFQTLTVKFSGINAKGRETFHSFSFRHADYAERFKGLSQVKMYERKRLIDELVAGVNRPQTPSFELSQAGLDGQYLLSFSLKQKYRSGVNDHWISSQEHLVKEVSTEVSDLSPAKITPRSLKVKIFAQSQKKKRRTIAEMECSGLTL